MEKKAAQDAGTTEKLQKELEKAIQERDEYLEGWKRAKADFLNYKRGEEEHRRVWGKEIVVESLMKTIPILDNLERAEKQIPEEKKKDPLISGFLQIASQFRELLRSEGIEAIEAEGKQFDPAFHEAIGEADAPEGRKQESGVVVEEVEKGYVWGSRLLRPAKVRISK